MASTGLAAHLRDLPDEQLLVLLARRPDVCLRPPTGFEALASRLSPAQSCSLALTTLDREAVQLAGVLGALGCRTQPAPLVELLSRTAPTTLEQVLPVLQRLAGCGLAWPTPDGAWQGASGLRHLADGLLGVGPGLHGAAAARPLAELRRALGLLGLGPARSVVEAADQLGRVVEDPDRLAALLDSAPAGVGELVEALAGPAFGSGWDGSPAEAWLRERCLLLPGQDGARWLPAELTLLARGQRIVGVLRREPALPATPAPGAAAHAAAEALALVDTVRALVRLLDEQPAKVLASGGTGVQEQRRLGKALRLDPQHVAWLLELAGEARLLATGADAARPTSAAPGWLEQPDEDAYVALVGPTLRGRAGPRLLLASPGPALAWVRLHDDAPHPLSLVGRQLADLPGATDDEALLAWLDWWRYRTEPVPVRRLLLQERLDQLDWLALRVGGAAAPWLRPLVDAADTEAAAALSKAAAPQQEDAVWQADGTAVVAGRPSAGLRALLDLVAVRESDRTWRLHATGVRTALDAGRTLGDLLDELQSRCRHAFPQVLEQLVRDVAAKHGKIRVIPAQTLLQVVDGPLLVSLLRDRKLAALDLVELGPGLLSSTQKPAEVLTRLRGAGHAPVGDRPGSARRTRPSPRQRSAPYAWGTVDPAQIVADLRRRGAGHASLRPGSGRGPAAATEIEGAVVDPAAPDPAVPDPAAPAADRGVVPLPFAGGPLVERTGHLPPGERLRLLAAVDEGDAVEIDYVDARGRTITRVVEELEDTGDVLLGYCLLQEQVRAFDPSDLRAVRAAP